MQAKKADFLPRFNKDEKNCFPVKIFLTPEAEKNHPAGQLCLRCNSVKKCGNNLEKSDIQCYII